MRKSDLAKVFGAAVLVGTLGAGAARAGVHVDVGVGVALPPPITFAAAPQLVVLPGTYVYAVPDVSAELYFVDGWWWRPWNGHWYRSHYYDRDWVSYNSSPYFYRSIPHDWHNDYSHNHWRGQPYNYERVSYDDARQNWSRWKQEKRWSNNHRGNASTVNRDYRGDYDSKTVQRDNRGNAASKNVSREYRGNAASRNSGPKHSVAKPSHPSHAPAKSQKMHQASRQGGGKHSSQGHGNANHGQGGGGGHGKSHK